MYCEQANYVFTAQIKSHSRFWMRLPTSVGKTEFRLIGCLTLNNDATLATEYIRYLLLYV